MSSAFRIQAGRRRLLPVVLFALVHSPLVSGEIFKWTDANGVVQYSDRPPAGTESFSDISQNLPDLYGMDAQSLEPLKQGRSASVRSRTAMSAKDKQAARQEQQCRKYQSLLTRVQSQLRAGYDTARGNRLREQRRSLSEKIYRECRS